MKLHHDASTAALGQTCACLARGQVVPLPQGLLCLCNQVMEEMGHSTSWARHQLCFAACHPLQEEQLAHESLQPSRRLWLGATCSPEQAGSPLPPRKSMLGTVRQSPSTTARPRAPSRLPPTRVHTLGGRSTHPPPCCQRPPGAAPQRCGSHVARVAAPALGPACLVGAAPASPLRTHRPTSPLAGEAAALRPLSPHQPAWFIYPPNDGERSCKKIFI